MSIRCAIVDDEKLAREGLRILLQRCEAFDLDVIGEAADVGEAESIMRRDRPDVLFLDINMPGRNGFELLNGVDPDLRPLIVFVTAHPEHAVRGFDASAVDYLLKPVSDRRLAECLRRIRERLSERDAVSRSRAMTRLLSCDSGASVSDIREAFVRDRQSQSPRLLLNDSGRRAAVDAHEIVCIRAAGDYMCVTTRLGELVCRTTMRGLMDTVGTQCIRVHRSAAVNPEYVREIVSIGRSRYRIVMDNGISLESSTRYRPSIRRIAARLSG
jgi:two-component system LytT family response regulator